MTLGPLLLLVLGAAFAVAVVVLVHEWRWRGAPARPPLPGAGPLRRLATAIDASMAMHALRSIKASVLGGPHDPDEHSESTGAADNAGPRTIRPARLVVSGSVGPVLGGERASARRSDPRARLARDLLVVAGLGTAVVLVLVSMTPGPPAESEVLGATGAPEPRTPLPAIVTLPPWATPPAGSGPSPETSPSGEPPASPSAAVASPAPDASSTSAPSVDLSTPRPTPTPRPATPRPSGTPTPAPSLGSSPTPSPDASPSDEPSPSPSGSPGPSPTPSPSDEPSPSPSPSPSDEPSPSPAASPSAAPTPPPSPSPEASPSSSSPE